MYASLGSISFRVLASPKKFESEKKYKYEPIYVIGAPPINQWIYDDLRRVEMTILLHALWGSPQAGIDAFEQLASTHGSQALVLGNGRNLGNFLIAELRVRHIWQADDGTPIAAEIDVSLTEDPNPTAATASNVATTDGAPASPPGLTSETTTAPGGSLAQSPATAAQSGIPVQVPYTDIPPSTIARGY